MPVWHLPGHSKTAMPLIVKEAWFKNDSGASPYSPILCLIGMLGRGWPRRRRGG